jgi:hypothetical protein
LLKLCMLKACESLRQQAFHAGGCMKLCKLHAAASPLTGCDELAVELRPSRIVPCKSWQFELLEVACLARCCWNRQSIHSTITSSSVCRANRSVGRPRAGCGDDGPLSQGGEARRPASVHHTRQGGRRA